MADQNRATHRIDEVQCPLDSRMVHETNSRRRCNAVVRTPTDPLRGCHGQINQVAGGSDRGRGDGGSRRQGDEARITMGRVEAGDIQVSRTKRGGEQCAQQYRLVVADNHAQRGGFLKLVAELTTMATWSWVIVPICVRPAVSGVSRPCVTTSISSAGSRWSLTENGKNAPKIH